LTGNAQVTEATRACSRIVGFTGQSLPDLPLDPNWNGAVRRRSFFALCGLEIKPKATRRHGLPLGRRCGTRDQTTSSEKKNQTAVQMTRHEFRTVAVAQRSSVAATGGPKAISITQ
jgi:hypothetical protein